MPFAVLARLCRNKGKTAVNAVECITREVGEREKITLIEIGEDDLKCMEVKRIVEAIKDKNLTMNLLIFLPSCYQTGDAVIRFFIIIL